MRWDPKLHPRSPDDGRFVERHGGWLAGLSSLLPGDGPDLDSGYRSGRDIREQLDYDNLLPHLHNISNKDEALGEIWRQAGYDGPPTVVDRATMDRAVGQGWTELYRGVGGTDAEAKQFTDQFRHGAAFPGLGGFGNGTYAMPAWRKQAASGYGLGVMRMALRPDARVVEADDVIEEMRGQGYTDFGVGRGESARRQVLSDVGRYASAAGYDAVVIRQLQPDMTRSGRPIEVIVLNRTALIVQDQNSDWVDLNG